MTTRPRPIRSRATSWLVGTLSGVLIVGLVGSFAPVAAEPTVNSARARAQALADEVRDLERRTQMATEDYNELDAELQRIVNRMVVAEQSVDAAVMGSRTTQAIANERVRALYMAGGSAALYATVLDSGSIGEILERVGTVDTLVAGDNARAKESVVVLAEAEKSRKKLRTLAAQRTQLQGRADAARARVAQLLDRREDQLRQANADVLRLAQEYERQREAELAAQAQQQLRDLNLLNIAEGSSGPLGTPFSARALAAARSQIGEPYQWGGTGPDSWDCSGLMLWAYREAGVNLPRTSRQQWTAGPKVPMAELKAGDLLFWAYDTSDPTTIHHVAMYSGGGRMVEAPRTGLDVREIPVYFDGYIGAIRPGAKAAAPAAAAEIRRG